MLINFFPVLLILDLLERIPEWIEILSLLVTGAGSVFLYWRKQEEKRLLRIENAANNVLKTYANLIAELKSEREERDEKIDKLQTEKQELTTQLLKSQLKNDKQQTVIESLKFGLSFIDETTEAPEDVREWLKKSQLKTMLYGIGSIRDMLLKRVETIPDRTPNED